MKKSPRSGGAAEPLPFIFSFSFSGKVLRGAAWLVAWGERRAPAASALNEVSGHAYFLHDGRARGLLEAILWHGGEAEGAKRKVMRMTEPQREALLAFLGSL